MKGNKLQRNARKKCTIKNILNKIPEKSGILLKKGAGNSERFMCTKCKRLYKYAKTAAKHYCNCKKAHIKRLYSSFLMNDIEWVCLQCRYHCSYLKDLKRHKRLCFITPNDSSCSIEDCIKNYEASCRFFCKTCSYKCLSPFSLKKHSCRERLQRMKACYVRVRKIVL